MERRRLKTVMILILALMNGFLLFSLFQEHMSVRAAQRQAEKQLVALFAADGITLDASAISQETPPDPVLLTRDEALEAGAAALFLGGGAVREEQGSTRLYTAGDAAAQFRAGGAFSVTGLEVRDGAEALCRKFCRAYGFQDPTETADGNLTALARYGDLPVFNCAVAFTFADGALREVSGTLIPQNGTPSASETTPLSASGALTAFQAMRRETWAVASSVTGVSVCYALRDSETFALDGAWRISTDAVSFYVNCTTGAVTTG